MVIEYSSCSTFELMTMVMSPNVLAHYAEYSRAGRDTACSPTLPGSHREYSLYYYKYTFMYKKIGLFTLSELGVEYNQNLPTIVMTV